MVANADGANTHFVTLDNNVCVKRFLGTGHGKFTFFPLMHHLSVKLNLDYRETSLSKHMVLSGLCEYHFVSASSS